MTGQIVEKNDGHLGQGGKRESRKLDRPVTRGNNQQRRGDIQQVKAMVRYHFDFDAELPDSLFTIDDGLVPKK